MVPKFNILKTWFISKKLVWIFLFLLLFSAFYSWIFNFGTITTGDWMYLSRQRLIKYFSLPSIWDKEYLGRINILLSNYPINLVWGLFSFILPYEVTERLFFLLFASTANITGSFQLSRYITNNKIASILTCIFYSFNTYFLISLSSGHIHLYTAASMLPLSFLHFMKFLDTRRIRQFGYTALFIILMGFYDFRILYITLPLLFSYQLFSGFVIHKYNIKNWILNLLSFSVLVLIIFICNIFWILPSFVLGSITDNAIFDRQLFGSQFFDIIYSLTLHHPYHTIGETIHFNRNTINILFFATPLLFLISNWIQKDKRTIYFTIITLVGIFLSKQEAPPGEWIYSWLYNNIIGFNAFREAGKFYLLTIIGYSGLLSISLGSIIKESYKSWVKFAVILISLCIILPSYISFWVGATKPITTNRSIPIDYEKVNTFLATNPEQFRTLWIPTRSRWNYYSENHPILSFQEFIELTNITRLFDESEITEGIEIIQKYGKSKQFAEILRKANIKYIGVPIKEFQNDDNFYSYFESSPEDYIKLLDDMGYLTIVNEDFGNIRLYEVKGFKEYIEISDTSLSFPAEVDSAFYNFIYRNMDTQNSFQTVLTQPSQSFSSDIFIPFDMRKGNEKLETLLDQSKTNYLYFNTSIKDIFTELNPTSLSIIIKTPDGIYNESGENIFDKTGILDTTISYALAPGDTVQLNINNKIYTIPAGKNKLFRGKFSTNLELLKNSVGKPSVRINIPTPQSTDNNFVKIKLDSKIINYRSDIYLSKNKIINGDFQNSLWKDKVSDCNNFDDNPIIDMRQKSEGLNKYLSLESTRHNACTATTFDLQKGRSYRLAFDYKSANAIEAGFNLQLDTNTAISKKIPITSNDWESFSTIFKIDKDYNGAELTVYSYATNFRQNIITDYDNFEIIEVPDLSDLFYIVSQTNLNLKLPDSFHFEDVSTVEKKIYIKSATNPFFLKLTESFNEG